MGVILAHHVAHYPGTLFHGPVITNTQLRHAVKHPAMDRFQAVTHIRQSPADDHRHGVIEIRLRYLVNQLAGYCFPWYYFHLLRVTFKMQYLKLNLVHGR